MSNLQDIYKSSFGRRRFDDGGSAYDSYINGPTNQPGYLPSGGVPSASDIAALTAPATSSPINYSGDMIGGNANSTSTPSNPTSGSLGSGIKNVLQSLGLGGSNTSNSAALAAGLQILGAVGQLQKSKSAGTLPALPALPGQAGTVGAAGTGAGLSSYGPGGNGYSYQNYQTPTTGTAGYGYAPKTQSAAKPSYFTYGQGPETQFFQQVQPQGGQITPVGSRRGGHVNYAMGGMAMRPGIVPQGALSRPMQNPMAPTTTTPMTPRPMMGTQPPPMGAPGQVGAQPSTMMQRMQSAGRPFAQGGAMPETEMPATGQSRYVQGPGDGTSDSIPARLSNGEYVMDAQTVSMLGNGDNGAGAKALDQFRDNLRRHKGGALSQGKMPPKTKAIHKYLGGQS